MPKRSKPGAGASVRTVLVAARIIDALATFRGPARLTELARALKMTLPRMSRHIATLKALGYVDTDDAGDAYRLGTKLATLGQIALEQNGLANIAQGHMARLRDQIGHTVLLSTRADNGATVLLCVANTGMAHIMVRPGTVLELPASPSARIMHVFTEGGARVPEDRAAFARANYYDFQAEVRGTGLGSIATPVFDHTDTIAGVLAIVIPSGLLRNGADAALVTALTECAARVSSTMGSSAWTRRRPLPVKTRRRA